MPPPPLLCLRPKGRIAIYPAGTALSLIHIYKEENKAGKVREITADRETERRSFERIAVLVDGDTASASEILTACLLYTSITTSRPFCKPFFRLWGKSIENHQ